MLILIFRAQVNAWPRHSATGASWQLSAGSNAHDKPSSHQTQRRRISRPCQRCCLRSASDRDSTICQR
jgi:hypothetical protein